MRCAFLRRGTSVQYFLTAPKSSDFNRLNLVHVAGTKGKGSVSAFTSSILSQYASTTKASTPTLYATPLYKVGLFTSPHLRFVRERIRINNAPLSESAFAHYFFEVWDRLESAAAQQGGLPPGAPGPKPMYFRFLTLVALHAYMSEGVDIAILEVGVGGEYDCTNLITGPKTTAVTSLGIDHTALLGNTLPEIAWHKAGIFKSGATAFTVPQPEEATTVLRQRAAEKNVHLNVVQPHPELATIPLGLSGAFQKINASLAIAASASHLRSLGHTELVPSPIENPSFPLPDEFRRGLERVHFPGRCDVRREGGITWHIDGAHTPESVNAATRWFAERLASQRGRGKSVLIFNQQKRDAEALVRTLFGVLKPSSCGDGQLMGTRFTHAVFTTNVPFAVSSSDSCGVTTRNPNLVSSGMDVEAVEKLSVQKGLAKVWKGLDPGCDVRVAKTVEEAVGIARGLVTVGREEEEEVMVLVIGSLHLVGSFLEVIESECERGEKRQ